MSGKLATLTRRRLDIIAQIVMDTTESIPPELQNKLVELSRSIHRSHQSKQ